VNFVSESGALEFFVFASATSGSSNRVKKVQQDLAFVSGFAPLPMIQTLGFHFCKWANVSAEMMIERNRNFTKFGFPVDVLWMDIEWADQNSDPSGYEYFKFNPQNFTEA
jgi:alpha 1,3-glucosidase